MSDAPTLSAKKRRILIAAAGKLGSTSEPGEREVVFQRINAELGKLRLTWDEIFERALPAAQTEGGAERTATADGPARAAPEPRHLSGDEIPRMVMGHAEIIDERPWLDGTMMFVRVSSPDFVYGPLVVFDRESQDAIRRSAGVEVSGRVEQPRAASQTPTLHAVTTD
jgi:hypothetical protein